MTVAPPIRFFGKNLIKNGHISPKEDWEHEKFSYGLPFVLVWHLRANRL